MLICLKVKNNIAEVFDTDDFTTEKIPFKDLLGLDLKIDNLNNHGTYKEYNCLVAGDFFLLFTIRSPRETGRNDYAINMRLVKRLANGKLVTISIYAEHTVYYPSVNLCTLDGGIMLSISYYAKHFYAEDCGETLTHVIELDKDGNLIRNIIDDYYDIGFKR